MSETTWLDAGGWCLMLIGWSCVVEQLILGKRERYARAIRLGYLAIGTFAVATMMFVLALALGR